MSPERTSLERAFQLAETGAVETVSDICKQLKREGYGVAQIQGPALFRQLREIIRSARSKKQ